VKLLLDTCTFLWLANAPEKLSEKARQVLSTSDHEAFLSVISGWEILLKEQKTRRLKLAMPATDFLQQAIHLLHIEELPLKFNCLNYLERLPVYHQDPFDRLLICQAIAEGSTLVTPDSNIRRYPVPTLW